jgi:uncharacterized protein YuzE
MATLQPQVRKARASYDREADTIGVYFAPDGAAYESSEEVAPGVVLDFDKQGRVIGVELSRVRELPRGSPPADASTRRPAALTTNG